MSDSEPASNVADITKAVAALVHEVPIYQDAIQPAAKEWGKSLATLSKAVNVALAPVEGMIWGYDKIKIFIQDSVAKKLANVPPEKIVPPKPHIAVPTIEALRYAGSEPSLADLYAELLATSMNSDTQENAHPSFVEVIKNMSADEAKIVKSFAIAIGTKWPVVECRVNSKKGGFFTFKTNVSLIGIGAGCERPNDTPVSLTNLTRLGIVEIDYDSHLLGEGIYDTLNQAPEVVSFLGSNIGSEGFSTELKKGIVSLTPFGKAFIGACVK